MSFRSNCHTALQSSTILHGALTSCCVQLDEFQDVSHAQYRLLKALTCGGQRKRVTIVGDADQAIYDWRGADV